uniref:hypothetical protein n=1 Tax=Oceanispirochaeta sp. TaxID=2035350 RepID=UPI002622EE98
RDLSLLEDLTLSGFCLSARRREAVLLKLEVLGSRLGDFAFGKEGTPAMAAEAFLRLEGDEVRVDDFLIPDLAAVSVTGEFSSQMKKHELMIRRKDQESSDYSMMRQTLSSRIILTSRDSYEENQRVRLEVTIDQASYRGELSYPDNKGIWGREFRYTLTGPLKIRVFTHLEGRGIKI